MRGCADDVKRCRAEPADNSLGHDRAYALDEAGAKIFFNALQGGGQNRFAAAHLELHAEARVRRPLSLQAQLLAAARGGHGADNGHRLGMALRFEPADNVAIVGV